jgi:hypothetical protein
MHPPRTNYASASTKAAWTRRKSIFIPRTHHMEWLKRRDELLFGSYITATTITEPGEVGSPCAC